MLALRRVLLVSSIALMTCSGCSNKEAKLKNDLKQLGLIYVSYQEDEKKDPASWDDIRAYAEKTNQDVESVDRLKAAGYEVAWGIKPGPNGPGKTVLAKHPSGGPVLMLDGGLPEED